MKKDAKIFIAGHRGMVGSAIRRRLETDGYNNIVTRTHHELNLTRQADTEAFFQRERPDYVFLAAARVGGIYANSTYTAEFIYQNLMIAANVIEAAKQSGVKKLLNLGSTCIYPKLAPQPLKEESLLTGPLEPTNEAYAVAKIAAIKLCRYYNHQFGTDFLSVMPTNLYGPNDNYHFENSHVLPALIRKFHLARQLKEGKMDIVRADFQRHGFPRGCEADVPDETLVQALADLGVSAGHVTLWGDGSPYREFLHADDLAEACHFLMTQYHAADLGEFVNIGTGTDYTIKDIARMVQEAVGYTGDLRWDTSKPKGTPKKLSDITRVKALGWQPRVSLPEGIRMVYQQYQEPAAKSR